MVWRLNTTASAPPDCRVGTSGESFLFIFHFINLLCRCRQAPRCKAFIQTRAAQFFTLTGFSSLIHFCGLSGFSEFDALKDCLRDVYPILSRTRPPTTPPRRYQARSVFATCEVIGSVDRKYTLNGMCIYEKGARIRSPLVGFQKTGQQDHLPCGHGNEFFQSRASRLDFQACAPEAGGISEYALVSVEAQGCHSRRQVKLVWFW